MFSRQFLSVHILSCSIPGAADEDDDFTWEDDEEDSTTPPALHDDREPSSESASIKTLDALRPPRVSSDTILADGKSYPSSLVTTPSNTSPRESEDSYDVVSSGSVSAGQEARRQDDDDEADSDWE